MGFRFWRRIKLMPGVTLNLSKTGASLSFGPRGARYTIGSHGRRATVGIPGTGLFYTEKLSKGKKESAGKPKRRTPARRPAPASTRSQGRAPSGSAALPERPEDRLHLDSLARLGLSRDEEAFVDGGRELALGHMDAALRKLEGAVSLADGAFLAGFLALGAERLADAERWLRAAEENRARLGRLFKKYAVVPRLEMPVTDEVTALVKPDLRGILLGLVEIHQRQKNWPQAIAGLERLRRLEPDDVVVKLSLAELLLEEHPGDKPTLERVVRLAEGIANENAVHAALLLQKARALRGLGLPEAARATLTTALRRRKNRPPELLHALRYERALACEDLGDTTRARRDLEKLYAAAPTYEDVATRLGL